MCGRGGGEERAERVLLHFVNATQFCRCKTLHQSSPVQTMPTCPDKFPGGLSFSIKSLCSKNAGTVTEECIAGPDIISIL